MIKLLTDWPVGEPVPAISLRQPWAAAVAYYGKDVENRSNWPFKHRGPLIIHASATKPYLEDFELFLKLAREDEIEETELADISKSIQQNQMPEGFFGGAIVAVANLADVFQRKQVPKDHEANESPWADNDANYWLWFTEVIPVVPVKFKGAVGMFKVPYQITTEFEDIRSDRQLGRH